MRNIMIIMAISLVAVEAGNQQRYVIPVKNKARVYENMPRKVNESALFSLGQSDRAIVLEEKEDALKIEDLQGRTGWVERRLVRSVSAGIQFVFGNEKILGYLDDPTPIYVLGTNRPGDHGILLDRSFRNELATNVDRSTLERVQLNMR